MKDNRRKKSGIRMGGFGGGASMAFVLLAASSVFAETDYQDVEDRVARVAEAPVDAEYGEFLAGECAACHAAGASDTSDIPRIVGRDRDHLIRAMVEYQLGFRENDVMQSTMATKGDEEIAALAAWFSGLN